MSFSLTLVECNDSVTPRRVRYGPAPRRAARSKINDSVKA